MTSELIQLRNELAKRNNHETGFLCGCVADLISDKSDRNLLILCVNSGILQDFLKETSYDILFTSRCKSKLIADYFISDVAAQKALLYCKFLTQKGKIIESIPLEISKSESESSQAPWYITQWYFALGILIVGVFATILLPGLTDSNDQKVSVEQVNKTIQDSIKIPDDIVVARMIQQEKVKDEGEIFIVVEEMPEFPGGEKGLSKFLTQSLNYPTISQENGIQGKVLVNFVVEKDGSISNVKISRGVDSSIDKEALRVVSSIPKWKPGKNGGKLVRVSYTVPISFKLE